MTENQPPSPDRFHDTVNAYRESAAIKGAIELELFTEIAAGAQTVSEIASACKASERGIRILCNQLVAMEYLEKVDDKYHLAPDSEVFLVKTSPAYMGDIVFFLLDPFFIQDIGNVAQVVRDGTIDTSKSSNEPEHPMWVAFARAMSGLQAHQAELVSELIEVDSNKAVRALDIASGSGLFGVTLARKNENVSVRAVDWPNVLEVATENAEKAGVADRHSGIAGSAFDVDFDGQYDIILLPNFLHHFNEETCTDFYRRLKAHLVDDGKIYTVEFVTNEDGVSPAFAAGFAFHMLRQTEYGDAYTVAKLEKMNNDAGLKVDAVIAVGDTPSTLLVSSHA